MKKSYSKQKHTMNGERKIIAPHLGGEEMEKYRDEQRRRSEKGIRKSRWEVDPGEEYRTFLAILTDMLREEQRFAGVPEEDIDIRRMHYLGKNRYNKIFGLIDGIYLNDRDALYLNLGAKIPGRVSLEQQGAMRLRIVLHESIHHIAYAEDMVSKRTGKLYAHRSGYTMSSADGESTRFRGLNEAITEKMCAVIFAREAGRLVEAFPASKERDWAFSAHAYPQEENILEFLVLEIAKKTKCEPNEVWEEYRRGMVNGDIRHLKEVDHVYGPGSLRFLSVLGAKKNDAVNSMPDAQSGESPIWLADASRCFREYFGSSGRKYEDRYRLVRDIFNDRELSRFKRENGQV